MTFISQILLAIICIFPLILLSLFVEKIYDVLDLILIGYLLVIGSIMSPIWYFQGTERLALMSGITLGGTVLSVPLIIAFVRTPHDTDIAMLIYASAPFLVGITSQAFLLREGDVQLRWVTVREVAMTLVDGWHTFISTAFVSLYTVSNSIILGLIAGTSAVGFFSPAETLIRSGQGLFSPLSQSVYPRLCHLFVSDKVGAYTLLRRTFMIQVSIGLGISIFIYLYAPTLVNILFGHAFEATITILRVMAPVPFLVSLSNIFGVLVMLPIGMTRSFSAIIVSAGIFNLITMPVLAVYFGAIGASISVLATECLVTALQVGFVLCKSTIFAEVRREWNGMIS